VDLSGDFEQMKRKMDEAEEESGPVYLLVNCAGSSVCGKLEDLKDTDIQVLKIFGVFFKFYGILLFCCNLFNILFYLQYLTNLNILGTILPTKAVISRMKERGEGKVVITASQAALIGIYGFSVYSATKFALRGFAEALQMEVEIIKIYSSDY